MTPDFTLIWPLSCLKDGSTSVPRAACLVAHRQPLLTFFAFPAERWTHLLTTNVITSPFATVRLSQRVTKDAGSRTKGLSWLFWFLTQMCARFSPSRSAAPWEEAADVLVPANQR